MTKKEFTEAVLILDQHTCRSWFCDSFRAFSKNFGATPHHIKLRSQGGKNEVTNGMALCYDCHNFVHGKGNLKIDGQRVTGRQFMIMILDKLVGESFYRWHDVHAELKRKEGVV